MVYAESAAATHTARVLVFGVDDGNFCMHLDWIEAVYRRDEVTLHSIKAPSGAHRSFLLHRDRPAFAIDLREAFDLSTVLGATERAAFLVIPAGAMLLALQVDACLGVRDLDLRTKVPVPSSLLRDGGLSVGHLVEFDGKLHGLLEPSRILSAALREQLEPFAKEAQAFRERESKLQTLAEQLRQQPTAAALKTYGRLSRRNGHQRPANAVRLVLKALQEAESTSADANVAGDLEAGTLVRDLIALAGSRRSGTVEIQLPSDATANVVFDNGRLIDAAVSGEWGQGALKQILLAREGLYHFVSSELSAPRTCFSDATAWSLLDALAQLSEERRPRQGR